MAQDKKTVTCPLCAVAARRETRAQLRRFLRRHLTQEHAFTEADATAKAQEVVPPAAPTR